MKRHWYMRFIEECPLCGHTDEYKERRYTKKPKNPNKRVSWNYNYLCVNTHFL